MTSKGRVSVLTVLVLAALLLSAGCDQPFTPLGRTFTDYAREVIVINRAEALDVLDTDTLALHRSVQTTGSAPNHVLHYDGKLYVTNSLSNSITIYSEDSLVQVDEIYLGYGRNPWEIISTGGSKAYVPNYVAETVTVIDLDSYSILNEISDVSFDSPEGGCFLDGKVYICNTANSGAGGIGDGSVTVIDTTTDTVIDTISTGAGSNPQSIIPFPAANELHIVLTGTNGGDSSDDGKVLILDSGDYSVQATLDVGGSPVWTGGGQDDGTGRKIIYLTGVGGITSYNYETHTVLRNSADFIIPGDNPQEDLYAGLVFDDVTDRLIVSDFTHDKIMVINADPSAATPYQILETFNASHGPGGLYLVTE